MALSSVSEGFPYSLIEAMTCGRTCVATDVGGSPRPWATPAWWCLRAARPAWRGLLTLLRDDDLRHRLAAAARARALEFFTIDGAIGQFDEIYSFLAAGSSAAGRPALAAARTRPRTWPMTS